MMPIISENKVRPEDLAYIIRLEEEDEAEVERVERLKEEFRREMEELRREQREREKTAQA